MINYMLSELKLKGVYAIQLTCIYFAARMEGKWFSQLRNFYFFHQKICIHISWAFLVIGCWLHYVAPSLAIPLHDSQVFMHLRIPKHQNNLRANLQLV